MGAELPQRGRGQWEGVEAGQSGRGKDIWKLQSSNSKLLDVDGIKSTKWLEFEGNFHNTKSTRVDFLVPGLFFAGAETAVALSVSCSVSICDSSYL